MPLFGAHQSVAGGLHLAFDRIRQVGGEALQIFTANQRQWRSAPIPPAEIERFRHHWQANGALPVAAHASYLINLATTKTEMADQSMTALVEELQRCRQLGIKQVVLHPGSHGGAGIEPGLARVAAHLDLVLERSGALDSPLLVLLETTAGQGTALGSSFAELAWLLQQSRYPAHLGICVDTCHIFAAGYPLTDRADYEQTMAQLDAIIGQDRIHLIHVNDSQKPCGSRVDRHAHIGEGAIGLAGFDHLVNDPRFAQLPMTLETPKGSDLAEDRENLRCLRALRR